MAVLLAPVNSFEALIDIDTRAVTPSSAFSEPVFANALKMTRLVNACHVHVDFLTAVPVFFNLALVYVDAAVVACPTLVALAF